MKNMFLFSGFLVVFVLQVQGFDLKCSFQHNSYSYVSNIRTCIVSGLIVNTNNETVTSINGETGEMMYDRQSGNYFKASSVKALSIESQTVQFMPKGIEKFFPSLQYLRITNSELKEIEKSDIELFGDLIELHLNGNDLISLDDDLFEENTNIVYLQFDSNKKLKYIGEKILDPLKNLKQVYFQYCGCISSYYSQHSNYLSTLKDSMRTTCQSLEKVKLEVCSKDFEVFEEVIKQLIIENTKLRGENLRLNSRIDSLWSSYQGNMNSATKNLHLALKKLEKYEFSSRSMEEKVLKNVNLTCSEVENFKCNASSLKVDSADTVLEFVDNCTIHSKSLTIYLQQTLFLPQNIGKHFPNVTELLVVHSGLFQIERKVFEGLNLAVLDLSLNKLIEIPADTFKDLKNLVKLWIPFNNIEKLEKEIFSSLKILEYLKLSGNKLVSISFEIFQPLKALKYLDLDHNSIQFISANLLTPLTSITTIDFSENVCINMSHPKNTLEEIENEIVDNCIEPIQLNCDFQTEHDGSIICKAENLKIEYPKTEISRVYGYGNSSILDETDKNVTNYALNISNYDKNVSFPPYEQLSNLIIINQAIQYLPYHIFEIFPKLSKIVVKNSQLSALHKHDFQDLKKLKAIEIHGNNLTVIEEETFDDVTGIEVLDLSNNQIKSLPAKIFTNLVNLQSIILSHNQLTKIKADLLPRKNVIEIFKADNNELELIETKILRYLRKAKLIDLSENVCIDLKFDKNDEKSKTLVELSGEIDLNCSSDD